MLSISNTGSNSFDCQCLLHTYYSSPSILTTSVAGLQNHKGVESVTTGTRRGFYFSPFFIPVEFIEPHARILFNSETDAKYSDVTAPVRFFLFSLKRRSKLKWRIERFVWRSNRFSMKSKRKRIAWCGTLGWGSEGGLRRRLRSAERLEIWRMRIISDMCV